MKFNSPVALVGLKRTYIGKLGGTLAKVKPHTLLANCFKASLAGVLEAGMFESELEDVMVGCVRNGIGNIARVAGLEAGLPEDVPAVTIDRQCASSMEAVAMAACRVASGQNELILAGGVESASQAPWLFERTNRAYAYLEPKPFEVVFAPESIGNLSMGETAEILADDFQVSRSACDQFAAQSHQKAGRAGAEGLFEREICIVNAIDHDECVRPNTTPETLATLRPVFRREGRLTAGNSSPINDGAASCLVMTLQKAEVLGITPDALLVGIDTVGLDPNRMGLGPALSIPRILKRCGVTQHDIDLFEINEAFSAQVLAVLKHLKEETHIVISDDKLNITGGAIALGHPLGATGLRLITTLAHSLKRNGLKRGLASLCIGGGQGMSAIIESVD